HRAQVRELFAAIRAGREVRLDIARMTGVKLVVDQRVDQDFRVGAVHGADPSSTFQRARSIERARASRDITVPTGTPTTSAISRYDRSSIWRRTTTSRNGCGSAAMRRR